MTNYIRQVALINYKTLTKYVEDKLILLIAIVKLYELKGLLQSILFANKFKRDCTQNADIMSESNFHHKLFKKFLSFMHLHAIARRLSFKIEVIVFVGY